MNFTIFFILSVFCFFHVRSDSVSELKTVVDEASSQILDYNDEFFASIIVMLSNLKDISTEISSKAWEATIVLSESINEKAKTKQQKECIVSGRSTLDEKIIEVGYSLDPCVHNYTVIGDLVRKKLQNAYKVSLKIKEDLNEVKNNCSVKTDKPEDECISLRVNELKASLNTLLDQVRNYKIEAGTIKPKILSESLYCNAKVLAEISNFVTGFQELFKKCV